MLIGPHGSVSALGHLRMMGSTRTLGSILQGVSFSKGSPIHPCFLLVSHNPSETFEGSPAKLAGALGREREMATGGFLSQNP